METKQKERIRRLVALLRKTDRIHLKDAARMLEVSVMTIRRDLSQDEGEPLPLALLGGYIVMVNRPQQAAQPGSDAVSVRPHHRDDLPVAILAAGLVSDRDLIFFDNGPEIALLIGMIPDDISFTGICYSLQVFLALNAKPGATAILCGGTYQAKTDAFYDPSQPGPLDSLIPRKAFICANGIHPQFGVTCSDIETLAIKRKALERCQRKFLLARHSLFDEVAQASIAGLSGFDAVISDIQPSENYLQYCRDHAVAVITPHGEQA